MANDPSRIRRAHWTIKWGDSSAYDFGLLDDVDVDLSLKLEPIMTGTTGQHKLGERIVALDGGVTAMFRECDLAAMRKIMPWYSSGSIPLVPAGPNQDLYAYAQLLNLHPTDIADGTFTQDLNIVKAVPVWPVKIKRDGKKDEVWAVGFNFYVNRAKMVASPQVVEYGYVGAVPA